MRWKRKRLVHTLHRTQSHNVFWLCTSFFTTIVGLETHSWWRLPISQSPRNFLCCRWYWKPAHCVDFLPSLPGAHWVDFDNPAWVDSCWCGHSLLPYIICGWVHICTAVPTDERKELGQMHIDDCLSLPSASCGSIHVGEFSCHCTRIYKCTTLHDYLDRYCPLCFLGLPFDCLWRNNGQELLQPRF